MFLGLRIERDRVNRMISLPQAHYARQLLLRFGLEACTGVQTPMETKEDWTITLDDIMLDEAGKRQYQAAIGSLNI